MNREPTTTKQHNNTLNTTTQPSKYLSWSVTQSHWRQFHSLNINISFSILINQSDNLKAWTIDVEQGT
jgi:hypothetical protein